MSFYCIYSNEDVNTKYETALTIVVLDQLTIMFLFVIIYHLIIVFVSMLLLYADVDDWEMCYHTLSTPSLQEYLIHSVDLLQVKSDFSGLEMSIFSKNASMNQNKQNWLYKMNEVIFIHV